VSFKLPPLSERRRDIPHLANHFLRLHAGRYGKDVRAFADTVAADVTKRGIIAWQDHFSETSSFFMAADGRLVFANRNDATQQIPQENLVKALTLGASRSGIIYRLVMPQVLPQLIDTVRLALGAAWLFLIAAEAIASTEGLRYRIFLVRRYLAMDIILPYVAWITFLGFASDWLLRLWLRRRFRWYSLGQE